jgi:hypothetical protein
MLRRWWWCLLVVMALPSPLYAQGALQRYHLGGSSAPPSSAPPTAADSSSHSSSSSGSNWGDFSGLSGADGEGVVALVVLAGLGAAATVTSPIWLPCVITGDDYSTRGYFHTAPYVSDKSPYMTVVPSMFNPLENQGSDVEAPDLLRWWSLRLSVEDGDDFRGMNRAGVRLAFDTTSRFGFVTNWNVLTEQLDNGGTDNGVLGDTDLTFRFAQCDWMQMYAGVGLRVLTDRYDSQFGFNFLYGADIFPVKPIILSTSLDVGNLSDNFFIHGRGTLGANYRNCEVFGGYDFIRMGGVNIQGALVGVRIWF